ncbi:hypothetical protein ABT127_29645 [Streptomyces sp. NPDC001904]|uniref:hypothetical protein n=1 Tax=Streptomyces sp. NPDC001904 TaxID=3154531 RepID=UPI003318EBE9
MLASRPETATLVTVPSLSPQEGQELTLTFSKKLRPKPSGWVQKVLANKKLRKKKATAATRLPALTLATHSDMSGPLGPGAQGIDLSRLAVHVPVDAGEL